MPHAQEPDRTAPDYSRLFEPLRVGSQTLRNRFIMGGLHTGLEHLDRGADRETAFLRRRAEGGVGLIITGAVAPSREGRIEAHASVLADRSQLREHEKRVRAVHHHGAKILLQIVHAGRYAKHGAPVAPSSVKSPIVAQTPRELSHEEILGIIQSFARCAALAIEAGYDGVELMGSEGYLLNQFTARRTNHRSDMWGGGYSSRIRFPLEVARAVRVAIGPEAMLFYRISAIDLVEGGSTGDEIAELARGLETAGVDALDVGVGWHEAAVPTIAHHVPRNAWAFAAKALKSSVGIPVAASTRVNTPDGANTLIDSGVADLVSMARPFLADPDFVNKTAAGKPQTINTCIACNQACLDNIFTGRAATCLVNPQACRETDFESIPMPTRSLRVGIVGGGPAGMACAIAAARRGHRVVLFEAGEELGGQLQLARRIPGKSEFDEYLRYSAGELRRLAVDVRFGARATAQDLLAGGFDRLVLATGVAPRMPQIEGIGHPKVVSYPDAILGKTQIGRKVAIIGTGGIGFDVAFALLAAGAHDERAFYDEWGVDPTLASPGGLKSPVPPVVVRDVVMLQRNDAAPGSRLGKSTGWILRAALRKRNVAWLTSCEYLRITDEGLHVKVAGVPRVVDCDTVVVCAGQESVVDLLHPLAQAGMQVDLIGGARFAAEVDAFRAIDEGTRLAYSFGGRND